MTSGRAAMLWSSYPDKVHASSTSRLLGGERCCGHRSQIKYIEYIYLSVLWSSFPDKVHTSSTSRLLASSVTSGRAAMMWSSFPDKGPGMRVIIMVAIVSGQEVQVG